MLNYSFVIPHKNAPQYLQRCIKSIPEREDIEIIIVDDCSEKTLRPQGVSHSNLTILNIKESKGAGYARNVGKSHAKGKWLLFADCDDFYVPGLIDELDKVKDNNSDIVYFDFFYFYNTTTKKYKNNDFSQLINKYVIRPSVINQTNIKFGLNAPWNKMFRRKFTEDIDARFEEIPIGNDAWFVMYCGSKAKKISVINKKLYYYVENIKGITYSPKSLNDIWTLFKSSARINKLKVKNDAWFVIRLNPFRGFSKYRKAYGLLSTAKLYIYKLFNESSFITVLLNRYLLKMRSKNKYQ